MVLTTASLYFGLLAFGCLAPLPLVKLKEIGVGFYRFFGFTCVVLEGLALAFYLWSGREGGGSETLFLTFSCAFLFSTLCFTFSLKVRIPWVLWTLFGSAAVLGALATCVFPPDGWVQREAQGEFFVFHALTSALLMGFATLAMMLGHWYLVTPKLSITPLKRFAGGYILLCVWKALELAVSYWVFVGPSWEMPRTQMGYLLAHREVIFVLFRVTWGVLAPLGFSYWIWQTVKMKSTQSATGILYAAMVCTLIGEGIGLFLTLRTGVPF